ncbi:MAG: 5,6-dimethylbenzimidazole synthase [Hyphomicrobium sp.]
MTTNTDPGTEPGPDPLPDTARDASPPAFDDRFRTQFEDLVLWRRDVRRFRSDPVPMAAIDRLIGIATRAPSVGNAQPWRFVIVESEPCRLAVRDSFSRANAAALEGYAGDRRALYARLKLEGLHAAPVQIAVFCDDATDAGGGLGRQTMPEMLRYSVVGAVQTLWLAARIDGIGVGWVSILEPRCVAEALAVPASWSLVAYLCIGYPIEQHLDPELERHGWQQRIAPIDIVTKR